MLYAAFYSSDLNTDIGSLKSTVLARGDHRATAKEIKDINPDNEYEEGWYDIHISQSMLLMLHPASTTVPSGNV